MIAAGFWFAVDAPRAFRAPLLDAEPAAAISRRRLAETLSHAARACGFYRERLGEGGIEAFDPIVRHDPYRALITQRPVSKTELRQAGTTVLAGGKPRPHWFSSVSSGSTGEPFRVYYDPRAWATLKYLVKLRARYACGVRPMDRLAILDAAPIRPSSRLARSLRYTRISVLQSARAVATELSAFAPDVIYGLPSALTEAAQALEAFGNEVQVRAIFTSGEILSQATRHRLAAAFHARVHDVYGTSETKEIAWECPHGGMHLNSDIAHLEVLDDAGNSLPAGQEGNLVVTSLVNRAMPLIRYLTGDRGAFLPGTCGCGRPGRLLGVVTGRSADVLVLRGGERISPYALTCVLERIDGVLRYQVSQLDPTTIRVRAILAGSGDSEMIAARMRTALRADVAPFLDTEVEFVERLPTGPGAKFRVVQGLASGADHTLPTRV